ncbi:forkhead box protein O1 [Latimeria chalumnae]|nr:PREDICTED: forkhead box protein O4 [Latimeria chalumnae]XP_014348621.1 PREDICTED: forkhead box protein O4 [Latimeria chalumnae]|eukprot:XP_006003804.1 PREDICTED: forkhead box protein O4 [Latimeria chalumnae]
MEEDCPPLEIDPDFEPQSRPRSCTWPLPRPDLSAVKTEGSSVGTPSEEDKAMRAEPEPGAALVPGPGALTPRKSGSRRNAWGNQSYAELISQAIESSPDKRLTLSQIYDWMVKSVPYFKDKGDSNSSAGWKNSIRHNLSLHNKFIRVHNEATGKSSWWMLNPEGGKSGKAPRRRAASMDNSTKLLKSKGRANKKKAALQAAQDTKADSPGGSQFSKWPGSPSPRSSEDSDVWTCIRPRTSSNASTLSGRLSPIMLEHEDVQDEDLHSSLVYSSASSNVPPTLTETLMEELELIDSLNLISPSSSMGQEQQPVSGSLLQNPTGFSFRTQSTTSASQGPSYGNSLFNPTDISMQASASTFSGPRMLADLLASDSPPPSDVMMTQVDPIMPQTGTQLTQNMMLLSSQSTQNKVTQADQLGKVQDQQSASTEPSTLQHTLSTVASPQHLTHMSALKAQLQSPPSPPVQLSVPAPLPSTSASSFGGGAVTNTEKLPTDLDIDMFMENLDCDVDYIINSDLMDGEELDFNFEPVLPTQTYPSTSQTSTQSWVPS